MARQEADRRLTSLRVPIAVAIHGLTPSDRAPSDCPMTPTEIEKMSLPDRLAAMESLWASLQAGDRPLASPAWHRTLLAERQRKLRAGKAVFQSLSEVRARLLR